jgi:hypothetical protein
MADKYTTFYLKDLIPIIEHVALDLMTEPIVAGKKSDGSYMTMAEVANQNSLTSMNNAGIRLMANALIDELKGPAEEKEADPDG